MRHSNIIRIFVYRKTTDNQSLKTALAGRINNSIFIMDGKNFTLRLGAEECAALGIIKKLTGCNTDSGAIKHIIRSYAELNNRYQVEIEKNRKLSRKLNEASMRIDNFVNAFSALNDLNKEKGE